MTVCQILACEAYRRGAKGVGGIDLTDLNMLLRELARYLCSDYLCRAWELLARRWKFEAASQVDKRALSVRKLQRLAIVTYTIDIGLNDLMIIFQWRQPAFLKST